MTPRDHVSWASVIIPTLQMGKPGLRWGWNLPQVIELIHGISFHEPSKAGLLYPYHLYGPNKYKIPNKCLFIELTIE